MYNVSNRFINASLSRTREISAKAIFNGTIDVDSSNIVDLTYEELCVAGDNPAMGEACSNKIVLNMYAPENPPAYKSGYVEPYVGLTIEEDIEWCPLGKFYVSEYTSTDDYTTVQIIAYDKMAMLNDTYTYTAPTTVSAVMSDIANQYDITVEDTDYPAGNLIDKVVKCTVRQMLGYVAGLMGKNVRFNKDGNLEFFWYTSEAVVFGDVNNDGEINSTDINYINAHLINKVTGEEYESILGSARAGISYLGGEYSPDAFSVDVNSDHIVKADDVAEIQDYIDGHPREGTIVGTKEYPYKATQSNIKMGGFRRLCDEMYKITRLESGSGSNIITSGTTGRMMSFENPFMTQAILDGILAGLVFEYLPCTIEYQGTPAFECGDIIGAIASDGTQYSVPIMMQTFVITGGMHATINSVGTTDVQSAIEINALEDILEPLEEAVENLEEKVGEESVATQIEAMKEEIQANLSGEDGTFSILYNADGSQRGWKITSTSNPNNCWVFDAGGMRYSNDGGQTFSSVAIDYQGNIYAQSCAVAGTLTAGAVLTNEVTAQNLKVTGGTVDMTTTDAPDGAGGSSKIILKGTNYNLYLYPNEVRISDGTSQNVNYGIRIRPGKIYAGGKILFRQDDPERPSTQSWISQLFVCKGEQVDSATKADYGYHTNMTSNMYVGVNQSYSGSYRSFGYCGRTDFQSWLDGSSIRFKHDIELLSPDWKEQIHGLYDLDVKSWTFNEDHLNDDDEQQGRELIGIIAEELEEVMPNAVLHNKDGEVTSYSDRMLLNAMLVLIQEQKQQIDELTERVKVLEDGNV